MKDKLRVVRVYHSAVVGEFRQRDRMLRSRHGHDVHVVCPPSWHEGGSLVQATPDADVPVNLIEIHGRQHPILFWYDSKAFRAVLRSVRPHIVDLHEEPYSLAVASAIRDVRAEVPDAKICMYTAQNIHKRYPPPFRQLERRALRAASAAYPCSTEAGDVLRRKGFDGELHVIPLGVTVSQRAPRHFGTDAMVVGFVGRLEPYKGAHIALRAFSGATEDSATSMEIVGAGSQEEELRALAQQLGVKDRVQFTGAVDQDEALRRIATYDVLLVPSLTTPSWKEQFGRIPAQAMEAGTPVLASSSGSLLEVVGDCGALAPEGDIKAFANVLRALLASPERREDLGRRGRQRAASEFAWERVADDFDGMYRGAVSRQTLDRGGGDGQ